MKPTTRRQPLAAQQLIDLLVSIERDERSFRRMAERAGVAPDVFSRVAGGRSGMSAQSCMRLAAAYGAAYHFTEDQVLVWAGHKSAPGRAEGDAPGADDDEVLLAEAELGRLVRDARSDFPDDDDYRLFRDSVLRNARAMRELARRKGRDRGDGG